MTQFRRQVLDSVSSSESTNAGLWLDKYLKGDEKTDKKTLIDEVVKIKPSKVYADFYKRWKSELLALDIELKEAETLGRLAVNLGAEATLENSIALNRTYGVPYIPGSALKGLAAHYAANSLKDWNKDTQAYKDIFGAQEVAGYVNFFDALFVPESGPGLIPDVVTVHHQDYYQKDGVPPADWDSPVPVHFLSASGSFLVALLGPTKKLVKVAYDILALALANEGIGAKTNSGYGRMRFLTGDEKIETKVKAKASSLEIPQGYQSGAVETVKEGYAFIRPDGGGKDVFVHFSQLAGGLTELQPDQRVIFKTGPGKKKGQLQALDVRLAQ